MASTYPTSHIPDPDISLASMTANPSLHQIDDMVPLQNQEPSLSNEDDDASSSSDSSSPPSQKPSIPRARAKKARKAAHQAQTQTSKPSLRPAKDILSRIRHDAALEGSDFIIGYRDRHMPDAIEIEVSQWKGGGDVTDEEWIPEHRILYFRKKGDEAGRRVWDREKRLDRLFGSGVQPEAEDRNDMEEVHESETPEQQEGNGDAESDAITQVEENSHASCE